MNQIERRKLIVNKWIANPDRHHDFKNNSQYGRFCSKTFGNLVYIPKRKKCYKNWST